jgi:ABC-type bacteriocin/lantibiotic exporter with double-glycine peptidase domain
MDVGGGLLRPDRAAANDGLVAIATILAMNRTAADPEQLRHALGHQNPVSPDELVRLAKGLGGVRAIGEVLLITLALNVLGLTAPLFFQNVIDKVLIHNTLATLHVLSIGFIAVSAWKVAFEWLRTRLHSETSQKLDVERGSKIFNHLLNFRHRR